MRLLLLLIAFSFIHSLSLHAQTGRKAQKEFLAELNNVLNKSAKQHSSYEGVMTIDSAFKINKEGVLSVTIRYTLDNTFKRVRLAAPVAFIDKVRYDLYLILEYEEDFVTLYESEPGSEVLKEVGKGSWFHVGAPLPEDISYQQKVQKALEKMLRINKRG